MPKKRDTYTYHPGPPNIFHQFGNTLYNVRVYCADKNCKGSSEDITDKLILDGALYTCPYCHRRIFIVEKIV